MVSFRGNFLVLCVISLVAMVSEASNGSTLVRGAGGGEGGGRDALSYMLIASIAYSVIPLVVNLAGGAQSPFLFNASITILDLPVVNAL